MLGHAKTGTRTAECSFITISNKAINFIYVQQAPKQPQPSASKTLNIIFYPLSNFTCLYIILQYRYSPQPNTLISHLTITVCSILVFLQYNFQCLQILQEKQHKRVPLQSPIEIGQKISSMSTQDSPHQEFCFNDSKFIFYIDNPLPKKPPRPTTTLSFRKKLPENRLPLVKKNPSTRNDSQPGTSMTHSRRSAMQSITNRLGARNLQSQRETRKKYNSPKKENIPCITKLNTQPSSPLLIKPLNLNKLALDKQQACINNKKQNSQAKQAEQQEPKKEEQERKLNIQDILKLFGQQHSLYQIGIDFMSFKNIAAVLEVAAPKQLQPEKSTERVKQLMGCTSRVSGQYIDTFHHQRAPILTYLRNIPSIDRKLYFINAKTQTGQIKDKLVCDSKVQKEAKWVKIQPYISMNTYPEAQTKIVCQSRCPCQQPVPFIEFLKALYHLHPDLITRLIEPPVASIYSVWLFNCDKSNFYPILVDPFFLIHQGINRSNSQAQQSSFHCCTWGYPYLWLPILIKAILKLSQNHSYTNESMRKIEVGNIYHMLTGLTLQQHDPEGEGKINLKKNKYLICDNNGHVFIVSKSQEGNKSKMWDPEQLEEPQLQQSELLSGYSLSTGVKKSFSISELGMSDWKLYRLPSCITWFSYSIDVNHQSLTKYQLEAERNTDFIFQHSHQDCVRVYLYQQMEHNQKKTRLILKMEGKFSQQHTLPHLRTLKFKLKSGKYKLFVEHGEKRIHMFFTRPAQEDLYQPVCHKEKIITGSRLSIQSSHEVKIGEGEVLQRNSNGVTQDSNFFYQKQGP